MFTERFNTFFDRLMALEGVHNVDTGGDTWWGIARNSHPDEPWPPTLERAKQIYFDEYYT